MLTGIVIPSYNEAESISSLINEILRSVPQALITVVDDSPNLKTVESLKAMGLEQLQVIHRKEKGGRGSAVLLGLSELLKKDAKVLIEMDADFSHPPGQLPQLIKEREQKGLDLLIASRYLPDSEIKNWPLSRRAFSKAANWLANIMLRIPINDYTNGYRCYSRAGAQHIVETCGFYGKGFIALSEILVNLYYSGYKVGEVSTIFVNRVRGESSVSSKEISSAFFGLLKIYGLKKRLETKKLWKSGSLP